MKKITVRLCAFLLALSCIISTRDAFAQIHQRFEVGSEFLIDAPDGFSVVSRLEAGARIRETTREPSTLTVSGRFEVNAGVCYYDPKDAWLKGERRDVGWIVVHGRGREGFVNATRPARLIKKEEGEDNNGAPADIEVYEETVPIAEVSEWGASFRRAGIDFAMPVKVESFREMTGSGWEVSFTLFPAFDSNVYRVPGYLEKMKQKNDIIDAAYRNGTGFPKGYRPVMHSLITLPDRRAAKLRGSGRAEEFRALLLPGTVWAAGMSEGRIQSLSIGYSWLPPKIECSPLSDPIFSRGERISFQFLTTKLEGTSARLSTTPDQIVGIDYTNYEDLASLRPEQMEFNDGSPMPSEWNILLNSRHEIVVVAPLMDGRGAAGMLELESLGLGDTYEQDLEALGEFWKKSPPQFPSAQPGWFRYLDRNLGPVPASQRGPETIFAY